MNGPDLAMGSTFGTYRHGRTSARSDLPFALVTAKLTPPFSRPGIVERTRLLDRLAATTTSTVLSVVAPPGYGKSTLLRQWAQHGPRPCSWLTVDREDNDPVLLLSYLAAALEPIAAIDPELFERLAAPHPAVREITWRLGAALATQEQPVALVLDDVHTLDSHGSHDVIAALVDHMPAGSQVAIASRAQPPLPMARLRVDGRIIELGPDDLAMGPDEATSLVRGAGVDLDDTGVRELVAATEGWPAAIYLAARSANARGPGAPLDIARLGEHRHVVSYIQSELLAALSDDEVAFLTRSAMLNRMSGEMCDAVLDTTGSADRLEALAQSNLLVSPLDPHRNWYRYHNLFRTLLRTELALREPELIPQIRRRASHWCQSNGMPEAAIDYAMAARDDERAAQLVLERVMAMYRRGLIITVRRWFDWFDRNNLMDDHPGVAVLGTWFSALTGHAAAAERWADSAERGSPEGMLPDGKTSLESLYAIVRAGTCRRGAAQMLTDAEAALESLPPASQWRAMTLDLVGIAHLLVGDATQADQVLTHAVEIARDVGAIPAASVALAERAVIALDRGEHAAAAALAGRACTIVEGTGIEDWATNAFVFAVGARTALHSGNVTRANTLLAQAQRLRPGLTYALPFLAVQARVELIRLLLGLADTSGARTVLREIDGILRLRPDLGVLPTQVDELRGHIARAPMGAVGPSTLTGAELRLLPLLQTHRTFRQIGELLFVSHHTVKTQAISIYRKLGVSSRGDAVQQAIALGLLTA